MTFDQVERLLDNVTNSEIKDYPEIRACCPAHDDSRPSLTVSDRGGMLLIKCFAGCSFEEIIAALKRRESESTPRISDRQREELRSRAVNVDRRGQARTFRVIEYMLRNQAGDVVAIHERHEDKDGNKLFMPWRLPNGTIKDGLKGRRLDTLPLFGSEYLKDIPLNEVLYVTEGEKDCLSLWARRVPAVATVCGASSIPGDEVLKCLLGRKLRLWRDNDTVGNDHMQRIAARLAYLEQKEGSKNGN